MTTEKTIYLHIGHYKTGSSAIQKFLAEHSQDLSLHGYAYPKSGRTKTNHGHLSLSLARNYGFTPPQWYQSGKCSDDAFRELHEEIQQISAEKIIISSEEFVQLALCSDPNRAVSELKKKLSPHHVTVVFYVREPLSLLQSWYNEVNKGPVPTRNFITFFMKLRRAFLSQKLIFDVFAEHFGRQNMIALPYGHVGEGHISQFLHAIKCGTPTEISNEIVQAGRSLDTLEIARLTKVSRLMKDHQDHFDDFTLTRIPDVEELDCKADTISAKFNELSEISGLGIRSKLTSPAIVGHYAKLLQPLTNTGDANPREADRLRDLALRAEPLNADLALALMEVALQIRPFGPLIGQKIAEYKAG